mgnify:CR=1 FL=1
MDFLLVVATITALLWGLVFALRGSLLVGLIAVLLAGACFGHPFAHFDVGPITLTLDRLAIALVAGIYVVQRRLGRLDPKPLTAQEMVLLSLVGYLAVSTVYGGYTAPNADGFPGLWHLIAAYLMPATIYWMARDVKSAPSIQQWLFGTLVALGIYLGLTGIAEIAHQWWAVFPKHIADPEVGLHFGRARGPMVQLPTYGVYLATCLLAAWLWLPSLSRAGKLAVLCTIPVMLAGVYFSYTRSVWLGAASGLFIVWTLVLPGVWRRIVLGTAIVAAVFVGATQFDNLIRLKRDESAARAAMSANMRVSFAYVSWQMFLDRPFLGCGLGNFPSAKLEYLDDQSVDLPLQQIRDLSHHNTFLSLLTDTGIVGLLLFVTLLGMWVRSGWRTATSNTASPNERRQGVLLLGALGVYFCQLMFHDLTYTPMENSLLYLLAGLCAGIQQSEGRTRRRRVEPAWRFVPADQLAEVDVDSTSRQELNTAR